MARIVVSGALANKPHNGGEAWVRLSWIRGLLKLGHEVYFMEELSANPGCSIPEARDYFGRVVREFGIERHAVLIDEEEDSILKRCRDIADSAELLINISGHLSCESIFGRFRRRAYVDIDPGFTQFWHAAGNSGARLAGHHVFFTVGMNIGKSDCPIPAGGIEWRPVLPPVVLDDWPVTAPSGFDGFTTIASWRGPFGPVTHNGATFGLKCHEFRKFIELPRRTGIRFEIALNIHPADAHDRDALLNHGWVLADPAAVAFDPMAFAKYIRQSSAEFSVAQGIYVDTRSGWFSDRTTRYLAAGRPAVVQDTGFDLGVAGRAGVLTFSNIDEAADAAQRTADDYPKLCRAARRVAEELFDSEKVLSRFLDQAGI